MRAHWKICIPCGQGMQYPQLRQKSPLSSPRSLSMKARISSSRRGVPWPAGPSMNDSHSSSSLWRWIPQMGTTLSNCASQAIAARAQVMRPPDMPFMPMKPMFAASVARTSSTSRSIAR